MPVALVVHACYIYWKLGELIKCPRTAEYYHLKQNFPLSNNVPLSNKRPSPLSTPLKINNIPIVEMDDPDAEEVDEMNIIDYNSDVDMLRTS